MSRTYGRKLVCRVGTREVAAFDCSFTIQRTLDVFASTASITILNLSSDTRKALHAQVQGIDCEVLAGYENDAELARLFRGNLRVISSRKQGPDWVTTIESGDGDVVQAAEVSNSYPEGTSLKSIVRDVVGGLTSIGRDVLSGNLESALGLVPDKPTSGPMSAHGRANDVLKDALGQLDLEHSWQDNALQILERNKALNGNTAVLLTERTGMLDSPELQGVRGFVRVPIIRVSSLLNPSIAPGRLIRVVSESWSGELAARAVTHTGSSWGGDWQTDVEGLVVAR